MNSEPILPDVGRSAQRRIARRLLPFLFILYLIAYLDRVNVGFAGLESTLVAARRGAMVALANKEALVCAGRLLMDAVETAGGVLLPVDSEHNAIFQVLEPKHRHAIDRLILTASGGPFRNWTLAGMADATPEQALAHPNWDMGAKISIDSATMMNKGLELIEAHLLFGLPGEQIEIVVHPQSVIHLSLIHI